MAEYRFKYTAGQTVYHFVIRRRLPINMSLASNLRKRYRVECECGKQLVVPEYYLIRSNPKKHCGCKDKGIQTIHKDVYSCWYMMRRRCNDVNHVSYHHYGGRGIKVCPEWDNDQNGFEKFLAFIGPRPSPNHSIDRVDNDVGYFPHHPITGKVQVKWSTAKEQRANQRKKE